MASFAWLIPVLPLASFAILVLFGKRLKATSAYVSISAVLLAFILSLVVLLRVVLGESLELTVPWIKLDTFKISVGLLIDSLSAIMLVVVTSVSAFIQIYSIGYMHGEKRYPWYFAALSLFTASMLGLVLAPNFVQLYITWELVGLCSYLLIGFWFEKKSAADAAKKAFIVTRIGDIGFLIGIILIYYNVGSLDMSTVFAAKFLPAVATTISLLLFCGAVGKSAQFPLHVWLPDAMEGPTPVSALIHAATMVAAGVYLVARTYPLFSMSATALQVVAIVGAITAFMAATIAVATADIKRILAYSTISQLGYMMVGLGVGAYSAAVFHLMTHAFFKALLFLSIGSVIHAVHTQNLFELGGLARKMKFTTFGFVFGALALAGVPPFSGFWSKDEIITEAYLHGHPIIFAVVLFTAFLTGYYIFRLCFGVFYGDLNNKIKTKVHESPSVMTVPVVILAILALSAGWIGSPFAGHRFQNFLHYGEAGASVNPLIMALSISFALAGISLAWARYNIKIIPAGVFASQRLVYGLLHNKYYLDEVYNAIFVQPVIQVAETVRSFDLKVIDKIVHGFAAMVMSIGGILKRVQTGQVQSYGLLMLIGLTILIFWTFGYLNMI
jgi:NADH-quinone oxidoreductase subunit L